MIISQFLELESNAVDYPHMIYDGAFSDTIKGKGRAKFIEKSKEYTKKEAEDMLKKYFKGYVLEDITLTGEAVTDTISCYDFEAKTEDGATLEAQITKNGGKLIMFNHYKDCKTAVISEKEAHLVATKFLENAGYKNMKAVWKTEGNNLISYNFASVVDEVICYSDLIKINVCLERGVVSGFEGSSYILNHVEREPKTAKISLATAKGKVSDLVEIKTSRLAIIPLGNNETLAYEFTGLRNGETYYIYIDAVTGKEVEIFKVVRTTEGTLIM
jgi:germination protein YpeB